MELHVSPQNHRYWLLGLGTVVFLLVLGSSAQATFLDRSEPLIYSADMNGAAVEARPITPLNQAFQPPRRGTPGRREGAGSR